MSVVYHVQVVDQYEVLAYVRSRRQVEGLGKGEEMLTSTGIQETSYGEKVHRIDILTISSRSVTRLKNDSLWLAFAYAC